VSIKWTVRYRGGGQGLVGTVPYLTGVGTLPFLPTYWYQPMVPPVRYRYGTYHTVLVPVPITYLLGEGGELFAVSQLPLPEKLPPVP